jgi:ABC-type siderophore export system fused ATPase/permease subunit
MILCITKWNPRGVNKMDLTSIAALVILGRAFMIVLLIVIMVQIVKSFVEMIKLYRNKEDCMCEYTQGNNDHCGCLKGA